MTHKNGNRVFVCVPRRNFNRHFVVESIAQCSSCTINNDDDDEGEADDGPGNVLSFLISVEFYNVFFFLSLHVHTIFPVGNKDSRTFTCIYPKKVDMFTYYAIQIER